MKKKTIRKRSSIAWSKKKKMKIILFTLFFFYFSLSIMTPKRFNLLNNYKYARNYGPNNMTCNYTTEPCDFFSFYTFKFFIPKKKKVQILMMYGAIVLKKKDKNHIMRLWDYPTESILVK